LLPRWMTIVGGNGPRRFAALDNRIAVELP
jgi:hypothetical protein